MVVVSAVSLRIPKITPLFPFSLLLIVQFISFPPCIYTTPHSILSTLGVPAHKSVPYSTHNLSGILMEDLKSNFHIEEKTYHICLGGLLYHTECDFFSASIHSPVNFVI